VLAAVTKPFLGVIGLKLGLLLPLFQLLLQ